MRRRAGTDLSAPTCHVSAAGGRRLSCGATFDSDPGAAPLYISRAAAEAGLGNLINEQAREPLPLPAGHARVPPGHRYPVDRVR